MMNFIVKKFLEQKIDKEDKKFIVPHFPGGVVSVSELRKFIDACEKFPEAKIKLSGELIIGGVKDEARNKEFRKILDLPTCSIAGFSVRPVKVCAGGYLCDNNLQDSFSLALKLDKLFSGKKLPFKLIISVSGCPRGCSEPLVKDIGVVASGKGYILYAGGSAGRSPKVAQKLMENIKEEEVIDLIGKIISFYEKNGKTPERLGIFVEKMGFSRFKEEILKT